MAQIQSQLDPHSEAFARNRAAMLAAIEQVQQLQPDVVVMDLHPAAVSGSGSAAGPATEPRMDGVATIQMIKSKWPAIRIVVLTMYATDRAAALEAGANAFLLKGCSTRELLAAMQP